MENNKGKKINGRRKAKEKERMKGMARFRYGTVDVILRTTGNNV